jgi:hypothetical protein
VYLNRPQAAVLDIYDVGADRGAARPAGHALRPQHDRRRDQICHPPALARPDLRAPRQSRHLQAADLIVGSARSADIRSARSGAAQPRRLRRQSHHTGLENYNATSGQPAAHRAEPIATSSSVSPAITRRTGATRATATG